MYTGAPLHRKENVRPRALAQCRGSPSLPRACWRSGLSLSLCCAGLKPEQEAKLAEHKPVTREFNSVDVGVGHKPFELWGGAFHVTVHASRPGLPCWWDRCY